jgi:hypothetical protein
MRDLLMASAALLPPGPHRDALLRQVRRTPSDIIDDALTAGLRGGDCEVRIPWSAFSHGLDRDDLPRTERRFEAERGDGFWSYYIDRIELDEKGITLDVTGTWEAPSPDARGE